MSAIDVQVRFAAEFALFLVSLAGLGFAFLRADLLVARPLARVASAIGFAALAGAALVSGSLIVDDPSAPAAVALRLAGIVLLSGASLSWRSDRGGRELLRIGLVALLLAEGISRGDSSDTIGDVARGLGALAIGACLVGASTRVISARIAASSAMVIFAAITVMAVALSAVTSNNIETDALRRYGGRVQAEADAVSASGRPLLSSAKVLAVALGTTTDAATAAALRRATDTSRDPSQEVADRTLVASRIDQLVALFVKDDDLLRGPTMLVDTKFRPVVVTPEESDNSFAIQLANNAVVKEAISGQVPTQAVFDANQRALSVAAYPLVIDNLGFRGVLVRTSRLNDKGYLANLAKSVAAEEAGSALAIGDQDGVLVDGGTAVPQADVARLAKAALTTGSNLERIVGNRFLAARPVPNDSGGGPVLAVVLSAPRTQEDAAREDLFRVLFLVALGSATAALALAAFAGERLGAGLRRLTDAAASIQSGDLDARAEIDTEDELGMLGRSFNAMAASLGGLTADLRTAAMDESALRGRLEAVVGGMGEALVAVDGDGRVTDFNAAAEELFDLPARDARGRPIGEVVRMRTADGTDLSRRLRRPVLEAWGESGTIRLADRREVPVAISAGTLRGPDNDVVGAVFVLRDERREAELERMKTEFLANISHELRTPLTPIKGFASILQTRDLTSAKARGFAEEISVAADQLERVIGQLVNFATIVGGRLSIDPRPVPVRGLIDRTIKPWRSRVDGTHKLVRRVSTGIPDVVADSTYLAQALDELIDNAVKYSPDGGRIVVGAGVVEGEDGPELEISVSDEGVGVPADRLDSVLQDFTQGDASSTRRFGGLGLGLALVHRIARAHGGDLRVDSVPDHGSTFTIVLPLDGPDAGDLPMTAARIGRGTGLLLAALIGLGPVAVCSSDGPKAGEARIDLTGRASVVRQGGKHEDVSTRTTLRVGDAVTLTTGTGVLHLKGGSTMELRAGSGDTKGTALVMGPVPVLQAGDLLVTAADEEHVTADQTSLTITSGSARITRSIGVRVAAYDADVALDSAGQQRTIPALREMTVPALGLPPEAPRPLEYNAADVWDRRFLGEAIDLGDRLEALAIGLTQNLTKGTARSITFYEQILPALSHEPELTADLLDPNRTPGETLIGAAITELGRRGTFTERWRSVFAFRDQGAKWGLVALDQGVDRAPLLGSVTTAVQDAPLAIGPPRPPRTPPTSTPTAPTTTVPTGTGPTTTTTQPSSPTTTVPPPPGGGGGLLSPVLDPVTNLLSGVLKALLGGLLGS